MRVLPLLVCSIALAQTPTDFVLPDGTRVPGQYLADITSMSAQVERARKAVMDTQHVDIGRVPVHIVTIPELKLLHEAIGGRVRHGMQLLGWELDSHVFVRRGLGGVPDEVLIHECLHAMSRTFANEAHQHGVDAVIEGITQMLALEALAARPNASRLKTERNHTYVAYTEFADALVTLVGAGALRAAYFGGGFSQLASRVDTLRHKRGTFVRACRLLDARDEREAMSVLTGS